MYVPNDYIWRLCERYHHFIPSCSVHPYRLDALAELQRSFDNGARLIKWLPNAMGIDPSSHLCQPYYDKCRELGELFC
jgi:predicted TIM-barrel fold metal-dependent hydrolase